MKNYKVTISKMNGSETQVSEFLTFKKAYTFYAQKCDELNLDNAEREGEEKNLEAGGRGYDYQITLEV